MTKQKPTLFSKPNCGPCGTMKILLKSMEVDYEEVPALNEDGSWNETFRLFAAPHGLMTVPVLASSPDIFTTSPTREAIARVIKG